MVTALLDVTQQNRNEHRVLLALKWASLVALVKNLPANAGDTGSIPGPRRFHLLRSNSVHASQHLSLYFRARELQLLKPAP